MNHLAFMFVINLMNFHHHIWIIWNISCLSAVLIFIIRIILSMIWSILLCISMMNVCTRNMHHSMDKKWHDTNSKIQFWWYHVIFQQILIIVAFLIFIISSILTEIWSIWCCISMTNVYEWNVHDWRTVLWHEMRL